MKIIVVYYIFLYFCFIYYSVDKMDGITQSYLSHFRLPSTKHTGMLTQPVVRHLTASLKVCETLTEMTRWKTKRCALFRYSINDICVFFCFLNAMLDPAAFSVSLYPSNEVINSPAHTIIYLLAWNSYCWQQILLFCKK